MDAALVESLGEAVASVPLGLRVAFVIALGGLLIVGPLAWWSDR